MPKKQAPRPANAYPTEGPYGENAHSELLAHLRARPGPSGLSSATTAEQAIPAGWDGSGKVIIITGCNTGLGKESARALAARGAEVVMAVRDTARGEAAAADIRAQHPSAKLSVMACDLSSLQSVKHFAADFAKTGKPCHILMCNAGVMMCPFGLTVDGHETQFATNHLGHHALVQQLLPVLKSSGSASEPARIVVLSSAAHFGPYTLAQGGPIRWDALNSEEGYKPHLAYGQSKLCNVLFMRELHKRLAAEGAPVVAVACHPGVIMTELGRHVQKTLNPVLRVAILALLSWAFKSIPQGAATSVYLCTSPDIKTKSGEYFADCNLSPSTAASHDADAGARLWELSEKLVSQAAAGGSKA